VGLEVFRVNHVAATNAITMTTFWLLSTEHRSLRARGLDSENISRGLVKKAVDSLIRIHHFDRPTAQNWIREVAG
jgi:hypothetical protein